MSKNDGGPAFPRAGDALTRCDGMSLRDWLAGQAIGGLITGRDWSFIPDAHEKMTAWARAAYSVADEMLAEREQGR
jgi:hypothetical protein